MRKASYRFAPATLAAPILSWRASKGLEDRLAFDPFVLCHGTENGVQRSNAKVFVGRNGQTLVRGFFGFQHDVAAFLMDDPIAPVPAKRLDKVVRSSRVGSS